MTDRDAKTWQIYQGNDTPPDAIERLPEPPGWRRFQADEAGFAERQRQRGENFEPPPEAIDMVNAALCLRRPLLITGKPGTGKSSLAYAVAHALELGSVLKWAITTRTTLKDGLYSYDAIARLQDAQSSGKDNREQIGDYITLGALGTAFLSTARPRVLLIDEIDKSDIDLANDLLNLFEDGEFVIPELQRLRTEVVQVRTVDLVNSQPVETAIRNGIVRCQAFPLVIMTSNGERDFPPPFLRRCLRLRMPDPTPEELSRIVEKHLGPDDAMRSTSLIQEFHQRRQNGTLATDQLLNVIYMRSQGLSRSDATQTDLKDQLLKYLTSAEDA